MEESRYINVQARKRILIVSQNRCEYCKSPKDFSIDLFSFDHIIPIALGGKTVFINLAYSCGACNSYKSSKITGVDDETNKEALLFHPRLQEWSSHFQWNDDNTQLIGKTPTG